MQHKRSWRLFTKLFKRAPIPSPSWVDIFVQLGNSPRHLAYCKRKFAHLHISIVLLPLVNSILERGAKFEDLLRMDSSKSPLFEVYLRLRPPPLNLQSHATQNLYPQLPSSTSNASPERFLTVEPPSPTSARESDAPATHITIHPPSESRKRAVEKFGFTRVFEEQTSQLDVLEGIGARTLIEGVLDEGRDGLLATLGVTGSGKVGISHSKLRHDSAC